MQINTGLGLLPAEALILELFLCAAHEKKRLTCMKAKDFDEKFDNDEGILDYLDLSKAKRILQDQKRINVDFPVWMLESLDKEASRVGVTRQSIIKIWLAERLEQVAVNINGARLN